MEWFTFYIMERWSPILAQWSLSFYCCVAPFFPEYSRISCLHWLNEMKTRAELSFFHQSTLFHQPETMITCFNLHQSRKMSGKKGKWQILQELKWFSNKDSKASSFYLDEKKEKNIMKKIINNVSSSWDMHWYCRLQIKRNEPKCITWKVFYHKSSFVSFPSLRHCKYSKKKTNNIISLKAYLHCSNSWNKYMYIKKKRKRIYSFDRWNLVNWFLQINSQAISHC